MPDWMKNIKIPLFGISISWGGGKKPTVDKVSLGGLPVYKDEYQKEKERKEKEELKKALT